MSDHFVKRRETSFPLPKSMSIDQHDHERATTIAGRTSTATHESAGPSGGATSQRTDPSESRHTMREMYPSWVSGSSTSPEPSCSAMDCGIPQ